MLGRIPQSAPLAKVGMASGLLLLSKKTHIKTSSQWHDGDQAGSEWEFLRHRRSTRMMTILSVILSNVCIICLWLSHTEL